MPVYCHSLGSKSVHKILSVGSKWIDGSPFCPIGQCVYDPHSYFGSAYFSSLFFFFFFFFFFSLFCHHRHPPAIVHWQWARTMILVCWKAIEMDWTRWMVLIIVVSLAKWGKVSWVGIVKIHGKKNKKSSDRFLGGRERDIERLRRGIGWTEKNCFVKVKKKKKKREKRRDHGNQHHVQCVNKFKFLSLSLQIIWNLVVLKVLILQATGEIYSVQEMKRIERSKNTASLSFSLGILCPVSFHLEPL